MLIGVLPAAAATISGVVTDARSAPMPGTRVVLRDVATRQEFVAETGADGRFKHRGSDNRHLLDQRHAPRLFRSRADRDRGSRRPGSSTCRCAWKWGSLAAAVVVTASRAERDTRQIPLHVDTITKAAVEQTQPALHRRCADDGGQHHAGRQRAVRRAAAAARPGLDAPAGAGGRRAIEHGAAGDGSHRAPRWGWSRRIRSAAWRWSTAPAR